MIPRLRLEVPRLRLEVPRLRLEVPRLRLMAGCRSNDRRIRQIRERIDGDPEAIESTPVRTFERDSQESLACGLVETDLHLGGAHLQTARTRVRLLRQPYLADSRATEPIDSTDDARIGVA
jgi:hypothetical protein